MKRILLVLPILLFSCELFPVEPTLSAPAPAYSGTPMLAFDYDNSPGFAGYLRFYNKSLGVNTYSWDFGFKDGSGIQATSTTSSPKVKYPGNGNYKVTLSAVGNDERRYSISQTVIVSNH
jgi:PKD repeat protein